MIIRKSSVRNFTQRGVDLQGAAGTRVYLQDSQVINNAGGGFFMQGASGALVLSANTLAFSNPSLAISNGANVISYRNNVFRNAASPTSSIPMQ